MLTIKNFQNYKFVSLFYCDILRRDYDYSEKLKIIKEEQRLIQSFKSKSKPVFDFVMIGMEYVLIKIGLKFDNKNHKGWNYF